MREAALDAAEADTIAAGCIVRIVEREVWRAAASAAFFVRGWRRTVEEFERLSEAMDGLEGEVERMKARIVNSGSRRKMDGGLPEEKVDSALGMLRLRAVDAEKRLIEVSPSSSPSKCRIDGSLGISSREWLEIDENGAFVGRPWRAFSGIEAEDGKRILRMAVEEYLARRPSAFDEAALDTLLSRMRTAKLDLDKQDDAETKAWKTMQAEFRDAEELRVALSSLDSSAAEALPRLILPEDPYGNRSGADDLGLRA